MSSTRRSKDSSVFHQSRYASSPEFERGLIGNLVAKRAAVLDEKSDRELIWFIQYLSHREGSLSAIATDLIQRYADRLQTSAMVEIGMKPGRIYNADEVRKIRRALPDECAEKFLLKGEMVSVSGGITTNLPPDTSWDCEWVTLRKEFLAVANQNPLSYPASDFVEVCHVAATKELENFLRELCLDPAVKLTAGPWYFSKLFSTLLEYKDDFIKAKSAGVVTTALGEKVCEVLNYTSHSRGLTLMEGDARTGKTFAARTWCEQHPGLARFVEVPPGNDEASFFRALARGLGLGNFLNYKVSEIRGRVESVLLGSDILLVLDEAQRLWPQRNLRYGFPSRIVWVMTMANAGVPMAMVSTPQFTLTQKAVERNGWNSAQLIGRITHYEALPTDLSTDDLIAVARTGLPEADAQVLKAMAIYARSSARYLAAIDAIANRARFIAMCDGRNEATTADARKAMQESVIPADSKLVRALDAGGKSKTGALTPSPVPAMPFENHRKADAETLPAHSRAGTGLSRSRAHSEFKAPLMAA